eukprot:TRINITY_DN0_c0_g1_i1.p4 TRINITY_DN0_c0_g1~~TRINITY_DN0_c0_g1_i1.p4  ORF type:complete len:52 (+),score=6.29 TRINITY_DN0_c0_g1_i1:1693-1848(+)
MSSRAWRSLSILFLLRVVENSEAASDASLCETASSADLGVSSKYSNENFED